MDVAHTQALWSSSRVQLRAGRRCALAHESSPLKRRLSRAAVSTRVSARARRGCPVTECPLVNTPLGMQSRQYSGSPWLLPAVLRASSAKSSEKPELESVSTCAVG